MRESLAPTVREKNSPEELEAARKAEAEKGQGSVFDAVAETVKEDSEATEESRVATTKGKKKAVEVRMTFASFLRPQHLTRASTNTLQQTSKYRTESSTCSVDK